MAIYNHLFSLCFHNPPLNNLLDSVPVECYDHEVSSAEKSPVHLQRSLDFRQILVRGHRARDRMMQVWASQRDADDPRGP